MYIYVFLMSVMWQLLYVNHYFLQSEPDNDDTIIDEDPAEKTADITEEQNETVLEKSIDKTIELHESETSNEKERATCVDDEPNKNVVVDDDVNDPEVNKQLTGSVDDGAPLASMESDPAPLASLESSTTAEMPSM